MIPEGPGFPAGNDGQQVKRKQAESTAAASGGTVFPENHAESG